MPRITTPARLLVILTGLSSFLLSSAQLSLPNPPFLPPNSSWGAVPSSGGSPNPQWTTLLGDLLYFYEAQRSGKLPANKRVPWRNDSALEDGSDVHLDLTGGYYDAGDYIKCTFPLSFTLMSICWGAIDYGKGYDMTQQTPYLDSMLRWGLDWLIKAHPSSDTLYVQVGDANIDNEYWGGDRNIPTNRPSLVINDTSPGTDAAAAASAAFASCSILYSNSSSSTKSTPNASLNLQPASLQNASYSQTLLKHAEQLYYFASSPSNQTLYSTSVPAAGEAYASSSYYDDLTFSALWLAWAQKNATLYNQAWGMYENWGLGNETGGLDGAFNWDGKTPGIPVLGVQVAQVIGGNGSKWVGEAERYGDAVVAGSGKGYFTGGGLLYYDGDSDEASLNPALNAAMLLMRYAPLASTSSKTSAYLSFAKSQVDYVLGNNPMSAPYVVGANPNSPTNPHSAMAAGGQDITKIDTSPPQEAYVIYGAVVGGPDKKDNFWDIRSDWPETEIALDYNAPLLTLVAAHALNDTTDPFYTSLQAGEYAKRKPNGHPCDAVFSCVPTLSETGKIAMGVVLGVLGLIVFGLLGWWVVAGRGGGYSPPGYGP
ncbi:glycoside hydrolase family 9 protein [Jaapia argillacea MUCL 33604]|uniref:Endoglucanase n=1 Tax=Jaapia argillacea MUCL 33604 TaxID=933084 RepID=A0A067QCK9_9AGAM|nr:glycoside hydrolase family 9 protein [Jaapia argillacea MUCL 33604]